MLRNKQTKSKLTILLTAVAVFLLAMAPGTVAGAVIYYVDASASGINDGSSWIDAYNELQDALAVAISGDEIWVAQGTYKPTTGSDRTATFQLISGVAIYGFFGGETILSGDLGGNDVGFTNNAENSYHVVTGSGTNVSAVLDGFTITAGSANGISTDRTDRGGGMFNNSGSPTIINCTFIGNHAGDCGGGLYN